MEKIMTQDEVSNEEAAIRALEAEGMSRSDAQAVYEARQEKEISIGSHKVFLMPKHAVAVAVSYAEGKPVLLAAPMNADGSVELDDADEPNFCQVCAPSSDEFLEEVNAHFGTSYTMDQFSGR